MAQTVKTVAIALPLSLLLLFAYLFVTQPKKDTVPPPPPSLTTQSRGGGAVTAEVTPLELAISKPAKFEVSFNTHSEELDFDVTKLATLSDSQQNSYPDPIWDGDPPGGHHRKGILTFPKPLANRGKVILTIASISGVTREFTWTIP